MGSSAWARISVKNETNARALIQLYHKNDTNGKQCESWWAEPGQTVGYLTVYFQSGWEYWNVMDYWSVKIHIPDGSQKGVYRSMGANIASVWKQCQLQSGDSSKSITFNVNTDRLELNLKSGGCKALMYNEGPYRKVQNIFVLMFENRSFDHVFAMSGIPGITAATTADSNSANENTYNVAKGAPDIMTEDPAHEFEDVVEQLCGSGATYSSGQSYPPIDNSGFAESYAALTSSKTQEIMDCMDTPQQVPATYKLATEFAICDKWFSSLPGPTWPNRFFIHAGYSAGLDDSPNKAMMGTWETVEGFMGQRGNMFMNMGLLGPWRIYQDLDSYFTPYEGRGSFAGGVAISAAMKGVNQALVRNVTRLSGDLMEPYNYCFTFIEPNYGDVTDDTYLGGSSMHPQDSPYAAEKLLQFVYQAIRNSPIWDTSMLVVTCDEHGGFYDSETPEPAQNPNASNSPFYSYHGFNFEQYGLRVPAVVVSPWIPKGTVDSTKYDHTSVIRTWSELFGYGYMTDRDKNANDLLSLLSLEQPRTDCPNELPDPYLQAIPRDAPEPAAVDKPLPESGNIIGLLMIVLKSNVELFSKSKEETEAMMAEAKALETYGEAREYVDRIMLKVAVVRERMH